MIELNRKRDLNVCCVYKLTFPNGKIYIGMTTNLYRRCVSHRNAVRYEKQALLQKCLIECGNDTSRNSIEILKKCKKYNLEKWEKYFISFYNSSDPNIGLNLELGGQNGKASVLSKVNKKLAAQNKIYPPDWLEKVIAERRSRAKPILQYDLNWKFIREWETTGDFARSIGKRDATNIHMSCRTGYTCYGFKWKYK